MAKLQNEGVAEQLASAVIGSLDCEEAGEGLARRACYSRPHFHRLFRSLLMERPGEMRRRLLLERAAYQLGRSRVSVTEIALDAQYDSLEAFTRAFRKAFGFSPSHYRRLGPTHYHLPSRSGIHFYASGRTGSRQKGVSDMDLFDRLAGAETWHTRRLLERARDLTDEQLDRPIRAQPQVLCWEEPEKSLRDLLKRIVFTKEVWTAALTGGDFPDDRDNSIDSLLARFNAAEGQFDRIMREVRDEGRWDDTFVDALCEEPERFTYGGMFGHLLTFNSHRRLVALDVMRGYGANDLGYGDPIEWERAMGVGVGFED